MSSRYPQHTNLNLLSSLQRRAATHHLLPHSSVNAPDLVKFFTVPSNIWPFAYFELNPSPFEAFLFLSLGGGALFSCIVREMRLVSTSASTNVTFTSCSIATSLTKLSLNWGTWTSPSVKSTKAPKGWLDGSYFPGEGSPRNKLLVLNWRHFALDWHVAATGRESCFSTTMRIQHKLTV